MEPALIHAVALTRIDDLHRDAAQRRRAHLAASPTAVTGVRDAWTAARTATTGWVATLTRQIAPSSRQPACCAA